MILASSWGEPTGQGWPQLGELALALVLSAGIGLERELRQKSAGLRTHTLVGFSAALIVLVSKYGFTDVLGPSVVLDPSRVTAQIVSGIGFIGGGLRDLLARCTGMGFAVLELETDQHRHPDDERAEHQGVVRVHLRLQGQRPTTELIAALSELDGVRGISTIQEPDQ